jgi:hypothetical protein
MNKDHVEVVFQGAEAIRAWRAEHPDGVLDLSSADLTWVDLAGANLAGANLAGAKLTGATGIWQCGPGGIWQCGPGGSRGDILCANIREGVLWFYTGCFAGTADEFEAAVQKTHGDNEYGRYYRAAIVMARAWMETQK